MIGSWRDKEAGEYVPIRMSRNDYRGTEEKYADDARLRGKLGTKAANRLINHIDEYKSWR